ncbi:MAG: sulfurtransferase [Myxococcales bacterium]|nr:sulfurtransferase [Myxococcales bacterium]
MISTALVDPNAPELRAPPTILLDARSGPDARARYLAEHLRGARFVDLESDLSAPDDPARGGRHPLPPIARWAETLGRLGIGPDDDVVVYDDMGGANAAARAWWMLRAAGHTRVAVLDGGWAAARAAGLPCESGEAHWDGKAPYPTAAYALPTVDLAGVEAAQATGTRVLVDVRSAPRYRGEEEPIDPVAGHIPGALNHPLTQHLGPDGRFLPPAELRAQYEALLQGCPASDLVLSCGSGVTACHGLLALEHAGLPGAALYVGSFSEWCRVRPVATSRET